MMSPMRAVSALLLASALMGCGVKIDGAHGEVQTPPPDADDNGGGSDSGITVLPPDAPSLRTCTGGDAHGDDGTDCFVYFKTELNFANAQAACQQIFADAHLAIVLTQAENTLIGSLIGTAADPASTVFLGGTDQVTEGTWKWVDNTDFWLGGPNGQAKQPFTFWGADPTNPSQPNNDNGKSQEDCLVMRGDTQDTWFDRPCDTEAGASSPGLYGYICEFKLDPTASP